MNTNKAKHVLTTFIFYFAPSIITTILFECLIVFFHINVFGIIKQHSTFTGLTFFVSFIVAIRDIIGLGKDNSDSKKSSDNKEGYEKSIYQNAHHHIKRIYDLAKQSGFTCTLFLLLVWVVLPSCFAQYHPIGKGINRLSYAIEQLRQSETPQPTSKSTPEPSPPDIILPPSSSDSPVPSQQFLANPRNFYELSDEESDRLYFKSGEFAIQDWTDSSKVTSSVRMFIQDVRKARAINEFDLYAPNDVRNAIAKANTDPSTVADSLELDNLIILLNETWKDYPKFRLSWMLANCFQKYGLEYGKVNGYFETIEYYYGQSVFWTWTSIMYLDLDDYQIRTCLQYISMRYHDIADKAPEGSQVKQKATILYQAFYAIQNEAFPASQG